MQWILNRTRRQTWFAIRFSGYDEQFPCRTSWQAWCF